MKKLLTALSVYFDWFYIQSAARRICVPMAHKFHTCSLRSIFSHAHVARENDFTSLPPAGGKLCEAFFDTLHDPGGHWLPGSCYGKEGDRMFYRCTRPEPSPPASFSTSETVTRLKSPSMECFRAEAATANSMALWLSLPLSRA